MKLFTFDVQCKFFVGVLVIVFVRPIFGDADPDSHSARKSGYYPDRNACPCPGCCNNNNYNCPSCPQIAQPPSPRPPPVYQNPCAAGEPALTYSGNILTCSSGPSQCPKGHWCHVGATSETTCCCPGASPDPCQLPMTTGSGYSQLSRYYFNRQSGSCEPFVYRGMMGNQNCFPTPTECQSTCRVHQTICARGQPMTDPSGRYLACNSNHGVDYCGRGYWCHYGASAETTVCCPGSEDPCTLPCALGQGNANLPRYFYDTMRRQCVSFVYNGLQGNQNNFMTKEDCETKCKPMVNPCAQGEPVQDRSGRPTYCGNYRNACPQRSWCHFGADAETTLCCPGAVGPSEACLLDIARGFGQSALSRWYFDTSAKCCTPFTYSGLGGNQNNFLSMDECQRQCPSFQNPCAIGEPVIDPESRSLTCAFRSGCRNGYYCHVGGTPETTVCCTGSQQSACTGMPPSEGQGDFSLRRWYYDNNNRQCREFTYRGMKGNPNNFQSQQDCESICQAGDNPCAVGEPANGQGSRSLSCSFRSGCSMGYYCHIGGRPETIVCCQGSLQSACSGMSPNEGMGDFSLRRWYFDNNSRQCREFTYRGLKGNPNNFLNQQDCEGTCQVEQSPCSQPAPPPATTCSTMNPNCPVGQWCHYGASSSTTVCCNGAVTNLCFEPMSPGTGNSNLPRYYYNNAVSQCMDFSYQGLMGNQNNFLSLQECESRCRTGPNPCPIGEPLADRNNQPQTCSPSVLSSTCPSGYWCHVGSSSATTLCCQQTSANACTLPRSTGQGNSSLPRFAYDAASRQCVQFVYTGMKGNENNFVTLQACQVACGEFSNPCIGQPATTPTGQVVFCSSNNKDMCPVNFWCHVGSTAQTTLCCPGATNPCSVPLAPGTGTSQLQRWYYNADTRTCQQFTYFGLGGNQNNFERLTECESACPSELCALSIDTGTCNNAQTRYAYDRQTRTCTTFTYNGCGGNLNNFATMQECLTTCGGTGYRRRKS